MVCVSVCVCISQGTSTGSNCNSALLAAVTIGCNLSEPSFALVYVGITPHTLWGGLKRTSSDTAGVQALTKTRLWFICCVCCVFLKRDIYLHVGTCTAFYPTVIASRSIWHYNNGQPRRILLLSGPHTRTHVCWKGSISRLTVYVLDSRWSWLRNWDHYAIFLSKGRFCFHFLSLYSSSTLFCSPAICPERSEMSMGFQ